MTLRLDRVSLRLRGQQILTDVSLHVRSGDCYGFLGHNGAGKTTAMRIALGLSRPDAGRVLIDGFDAAEHPLEARARVGGLIEVPGFHGHLSARRNLELLAGLQGLSGRAAREASDRRIEMVGLAHAAEKPVGVYSQGMRQRLGIAQALLGSPQIILLDEPQNGLDPEGIEEFRRLLRRLVREESMTILLSSHQLAEVASVCTRIGILKQGRMLLEDETERLLAGDGDSLHDLRVPASDDSAASRIRAVAASCGADAEDEGGGAWQLRMRDSSPPDVLRRLVESGVTVRSFAPRSRSLEAIYLRAGDDAAQSPVPSEPCIAAKPATSLVRSPAAVRVARYEWSRWLSSAAVPLALCLPLTVAASRVLFIARASQADAEAVRSGALASATEVTGFQAAALGLQAGLPLLALVLTALAAQSIVGEAARGTLRNTLLRPVGRGRLVLGKALAVSVAGVVSAALLAGGTLALAGSMLSFGDLVEILPNGKKLPILEASKVWPEVRLAALRPLPAVAAFAGLGLLLGSWAKSAAGGMAGAFLLVAGLVAALHVAPEGVLPSAGIPWGPLRDTSAVRRLFDVSQGVSNAMPAESAGSWWIHASWAVAATAAACVLIRRRAIQ